MYSSVLWTQTVILGSLDMSNRRIIVWYRRLGALLSFEAHHTTPYGRDRRRTRRMKWSEDRTSDVAENKPKFKDRLVARVFVPKPCKNVESGHRRTFVRSRVPACHG